MGPSYRVIPFIFPLLLGWIGFGATAAADLYIYRDGGGRSVITDAPPEGAAILHVIRDAGGTAPRPARPADGATEENRQDRPKTEAGEASPGASGTGAPAGQAPESHIQTTDDKGQAKNAGEGGLPDLRGPMQTTKDRTEPTMPASRGIEEELPARGEQDRSRRPTAADPLVIMRADSAAFRYSNETIDVPPDREGRQRK